MRTIEIFAGNGDVSVDMFTWVANPADEPMATTATVFYHRADGNYADTFIVVEGESYTCVPDDAFGCSADVPAPAGGILTFTVNQGGSPDPTGTFLAPVFEDPADGNNVYAFSGNPEAINDGTEATVPGSGEIILYYDREDGAYDGWNMHLFPIEPGGPSWTIFDGAEACTVEGTDCHRNLFPHHAAAESLLRQQSGSGRRLPGQPGAGDPSGQRQGAGWRYQHPRGRRRQYRLCQTTAARMCPAHRPRRAFRLADAPRTGWTPARCSGTPATA